MAAARTPIAVARAGVGLAAGLLPTSADRRRYRAEFLADLHGMPSTAQLRYAAGVLSQIFALRAALGSDSRRLEEAAMTPKTSRWRTIRCRGLRIHYWHGYSTDDGGRYVACSVCRREHPGAAHWLSGTGAGGIAGGGGGGGIA